VSRWITSWVVAATLPTERSARREFESDDNITRRPPVIASDIERYVDGKRSGRRWIVVDSSSMNRVTSSPEVVGGACFCTTGERSPGGRDAVLSAVVDVAESGLSGADRVVGAVERAMVSRVPSAAD